MYTHKVQYYETDKMGIAHHSNFIRWMEEARVDFLDKAGWNYARLEDSGVISPVIELSCSYKTPVGFDETVSIDIRILEYRGVRLKIGYTMLNAEGKTVAEAHSSHCFVNSEGRPIRLSSVSPAFHEALTKLAEN